MTLTNGTVQQKDLDFVSTYFCIQNPYYLFALHLHNMQNNGTLVRQMQTIINNKITESREGRRRRLYLGLILHGIATYFCGAITANLY